MQTKNSIMENKLIELTSDNSEKIKSLTVTTHEMNNTIQILENKIKMTNESLQTLYNIYHNEQILDSNTDETK